MMTLEEFKTYIKNDTYSDEQLEEALVELNHLAHICMEYEEEI